MNTRPYRRAALSLVITAALLGGLPTLPARAEPGPEQLVNGTFDNGQVDPWWSTAGTPISVVAGELCAQVPTNSGNPWDSIFEGNPQKILERREAVSLPPLLIMQGELDDNVLPAFQEKFAAAYRAAGGECQLEIFAGCGHIWVADPGPQTDAAHEMVKAFIARNLRALRLAA